MTTGAPGRDHGHRPPPVRRLDVRVVPDRGRVVARPFIPGDFAFPGGHSRMTVLVDRILALDEGQVTDQLDDVVSRFADRHPDWQLLVELNAARVLAHRRDLDGMDGDRRTLVGAYFTQEYAIEAAATFNPSIVPSPEAPPGTDDLPFVMSLRGTGEGHISSIEFRTGTVTAGGDVVLDPVGPHVVAGTRRDPLYDKAVFAGKLLELRADELVVRRILDPLSDHFTMASLSASLLEAVPDESASVSAHETARLVHWLASSNYVNEFDAESHLSERVLMPQSPTENRGMEDARFVRFSDDEGVRYYATYTAFDGLEILPQLIETTDFRVFGIRTLNGRGAQNKGLALFPRRIDGQFVALSRNDRESLFIIRSPNVHWWNDPAFLRGPTHSWELLQTGNCGSPIETEAGWLVLTHGVGPMRRYAIGAVLLDLDDPGRIIGDLPEPLLEPDPHERDGYVPNVVYSCGSLVHAGRLVLPYGFSDYGCAFATVELDALLEALLASPPSRQSASTRR